MTPVFAARRRAEAFNSLLEGDGPLHDARYAEFLEIVDSLRAQPPVEARPEFVSALRERLMTAADTVLLPADEARLTLPARKPARERRIAITVGGVAIVGATTSMAMAAQTALPGDVLYPLKRAMENAQTGITANEGDRGATLLANATGRLVEVRELSLAGRLEDAAAIADTLTAFTEQSVEASDLLLSDYRDTGNESSIAELRDFTAVSMETLAELEAVVPEAARDELIAAARVITQIDLEAERTCPTCGGDGITEIPRILTQANYTDGVFTTSGTVIDQAAGTGKSDPKPSAKQDQTADETESPPLPPGSVLPPPPSGETEQTGGGGTEDTAPDPIDELTAGLSGDGSDQPTSGPESTTVLPDEDVVGDVVDPLLNP